MTRPPAVEVRGVSVTRGHGRTAVTVLRDLDLDLRRGEVLALLGPNGAGKTTTVRLLTTQLAPDRGRVRVAGYDVATDAPRVRERIGLAGQQVALDERQTGRENLTMLGRLAGLPRRAARERAAELLAGFDLGTAADRRVGTYSGGMRRRLDLAGALVVRPEVLFLDEPTTGLDPRSRIALWDVIRRVVAEGSSLLLTTQYLEEADQLADRIALLDGGRLVAEGTAADLKARVGGARLDLTFADRASAAAVAVALDVPAPDAATLSVATDGALTHVRSLLGAVEATGRTPEHWAVREPTLDDVFLTLTGAHAETARADDGAGSVVEEVA